MERFPNAFRFTQGVHRFGYEWRGPWLVPIESPVPVDDADLAAAMLGDVRRHGPDGVALDGLYLEFAALDPTPGAFQAFAGRHGLLGVRSPERAAVAGVPSDPERRKAWLSNPDRVQAWPADSEHMQAWQVEHAALRAAVRAHASNTSVLPEPFSSAHRGWSDKSPLESLIDSKVREHVRVCFHGGLGYEPKNLIGLCWLQTAEAVSRSELVTCQGCGRLFERGTAGSGKGKRSHATYCKPACRVRAFKSRQADQRARGKA